MTRIETIYGVKALKFEGFDESTNEPIVKEVEYEIINPRISAENPIKSIEKTLARKIGAREMGKLTVKDYYVIQAIKYEISDEDFKKYAKATDITETLNKEENN